MSTEHPTGLRLPPYRGILAVDTVGFTKNEDVRLHGLSDAIPSVLARAFDSCGLTAVWRERRFPQGTGDGYFFGVRTKHLPLLVDPFLARLQEVLEDYDGTLRSLGRELRLRLRVSINIGPVPDDGDEEANRSCRAVNETFRLLNSEPIKRLMEKTDPDVTLVGAIISQQVYEDVVAGGFTRVRVGEFDRVTASVTGKDFSQPAWLYVPRRSNSAALTVPVRPPTQEESRRLAVGDTFSNQVSGGTVGNQIGKVEGDVHTGRVQGTTIAELEEQVVEAMRKALLAALDGGSVPSTEVARVSSGLELADRRLAQAGPSMLDRIRALSEIIAVLSPLLASIPGLS